MERFFETIVQTGKTSTNTLTDVILKCVEEVGEISAEDLRVRGIKPTKTGKDPIADRKEESVDLLLATLDLCFRQMTMDEINELMQTKLDKWLSYKK